MISRRLLRSLSVADLREAIRQKSQLGRIEALEGKRDNLQHQLDRVERNLAKLTASNGSASSARSGRKPGRRKGWKVSKATREKMRQAALRRYAGKVKSSGSAGKAKTYKRSAATRRKMALAQKARWAKVKAQAKAAAQ